jgi:hypothetical protein
MPGIYGDMLAVFSELLREYKVFSMAAKMGAGYGPRTNVRVVTGYFSRIKGGRESIENNLKVANQYGNFYERVSGGASAIRQGDFMAFGREVYQFIHDDDFSPEGGYVVWDVQLVTAFTDQQKRDASVDLAVDFW